MPWAVEEVPHCAVDLVGDNVLVQLGVDDVGGMLNDRDHGLDAALGVSLKGFMDEHGSPHTISAR
jgi:hypothetical protein